MSARLSDTQRAILEAARDGDLFEVWPSGPRRPYFSHGNTTRPRGASVEGLLAKGLLQVDQPKGLGSHRKTVTLTDSGREALQ